MLEMASRIDYPYATDMDGLGNKKPHSVRGRPKQVLGLSNNAQQNQTQDRGTPTLPALAGSTPPPMATETKEIVPYQLMLRQNSPNGIRASADALETGEKFRMLESRLGVTEKSNRALLEEVLRLQSELRGLVVRNQQAILDERNARSQLDSSVHIANDLISQLASRIKAAEDRLNEEKSALSSLVTHTRGVEQAVKAGQQELSNRKDATSSKVLDIQSKLMEAERSKDQLERTVYGLTDELRAVRNKLDGQQGEFQTVITDLKLRSRRLEEENKLQLDALRKQGDIQSHSDQNTSYLRAQVESRLSELRDVIVDLRGRQDVELNERRSLEQLLQQKVNDLHLALSEQNRKREEALHTLDTIHRERERTAEQEKVRLQNKLAETVDELSKRIMSKEIKLREEMQEKYQHLEKVLQLEGDKRADHEHKMRDENDERWVALKKMSDDELHVLRDALKSERAKNKESVNKLDESISLLEKQLQEQKRQADKVIAAEIKSRKDHERRTHEDIGHVQEKLQVATGTLQQAIGGVNAHLASHTEKMRQELKGMIDTSEQATTRAVTDLDVRLQSLKQKLTSMETTFDHRINEAVELNEATAVLAQNIREKVESISLWQDVTSQTIRELNQGLQQLPNDIYAVEEKQKLLKSEVESRITSEAESRIRDVENLKQELTLLSQRKQPQEVTQQDLQEVQASVRKLAESIQTVKTVLGMKIQSEQKLRTESTRRLEEDIDDLERKVRPLLNNPNFVKDGGGDNAGVNQWGVYNAYRWLTWKSRIMYFKWRKSSRKPVTPSHPSSTTRTIIEEDGQRNDFTPTGSRNRGNNVRPGTRNNNGQSPTERGPANSRASTRNNANGQSPVQREPAGSRPGTRNDNGRSPTDRVGAGSRPATRNENAKDSAGGSRGHGGSRPGTRNSNKENGAAGGQGREEVTW